MTALCGGGASGPKPDVGNNIIYNAAGLAALLEFSGYGALATLAVILGTLLYDATTLCSTDPPAQPTFTVAELEALFTFQPSTDFTSGLGKLKDLVANILWFQLCQCTSVTTPPLPAPTALPPAAFIGSGTGTACGEFTSGEHQIIGGVAQQHSIIPPTDVTLVFTADFIANSVLLPVGATSVVLTGTLDTSTYTGAGNPASILYQFNNGTALVGGAGGVTFPSAPATRQLTIAVPAGATRVSIFLVKAFTTSYEIDGHAILDCVCPGPGAAAQAGCCPPDPTLVAQLNAIYNLLVGLKPPSVKEDTVHSGLSGNGTIPIGAQCIAIKVDITTDIAGAIIDAGSPSYYFNRGYIVPITLEAPIAATRKLVYNPQVFALPNLTESIGYSLPTGLVIKITELIAGS